MKGDINKFSYTCREYLLELQRKNRKGKENEIIILKPISRGGVAKNLWFEELNGT